MAPSNRTDIAQVITDAIIAELEAGTLPWVKPWSASTAKPRPLVTLPRRHTGAHYRGVNILILWDAAQRAGYRSPYWMTFKQAVAYKAGVRKGEKGTAIVYVDRIVKAEEGPAGEDRERVIPFLKTYVVFNAEQIEGLPAAFYPAAPVPQPDVPAGAPIVVPEAASRYFDNVPADVSTAATGPSSRPSSTRSACRRSRLSGAPKPMSGRGLMRPCIGRVTRADWPATSPAASAPMPTPWKN